jgi:hypothetical protein
MLGPFAGRQLNEESGRHEWTPSYPGYCLYYPGRRHMAASLRAFVDLAKEIVFRNRAKAS